MPHQRTRPLILGQCRPMRYIPQLNAEMRKHCLSHRVVQPWNALPQHVIDVPSTNPFNVRLDENLEEMGI